MTHGPVATIAADVRAGRRTALSIAEETIERVRAYDAVQPQAWIARLDDASILAHARRVDERIAAGEQLALGGVPYAIKDNIDALGLPTTAGCPAYAYEPTAHATVVSRLDAAGAVLIGKTNLDQFATGLVGVRSPYGAPGCVYNRAYVSGGSSSGSAVVVAANVVAFALGTDTAGSGRVPAAFNGLVGLKPTLGRWSTTGVVPACRSLDCVTVLARTVEDAKLVDGVCAGYDEADVYSRRVTPAARARRDTQVRIGVARPDQLNFSGDAESAALDELARARLSEARATVVEVDIAPLLAAAQLLYNGPWVAERTAAIGPFVHTHPGAVHPVVRGIVEGGRGVTGVDTFRAMYALKRAVRHAEALWEDVDVLALPTAPTIYRISEVLADPVTLNSTLGRYTNFVNLLDMAAIAIPAGFRKNHTGYGITLIGPAGSDEALQSLAGKLAPLLGAGITPDLDIAPAAKTVALAVVGAHLSGMPLHHQLTSRAARLARRAHTEPAYRLYAMAGTTPPKPALVHVGAGGVQIELEVYELGLAEFGSFVEEVPPPLAIGTVTLSDGCTVKGFVAEPRALQGATDVSSFGGWRAYIASR